MSEGRGLRRDYFGADGWLHCGCGAAMRFVQDRAAADAWDDESYAYCPHCSDNYYDASAVMMRADPVTNPWGWRSMIATVEAEGFLFQGMGRSNPFVRENPISAWLVAFHLIALEAQL